MASQKRNLAVGITGLLGLVGLAAMLLLFGYIPGFFEPGYRVDVIMPTSGGLTAGSRVRMADMDIGRVERVAMLDPANPQRGVRVELAIRSDFRIPEEAEISVKATAPIGGTPVLIMDVRHLRDVPVEAIAYVPDDGTATLEGIGARALEEALLEEMQAMIGPLQTQFTRLVDGFDDLAREWTAVGRQVSRLTEPRDITEIDAGRIEGNLHTILVRADRRIEEVGELIDGLNRLVNDEAFQDDLKQTASQLRSAAASIDDAAMRTGTAVDRVSEDVSALAKRLFAVADDLSGAVGSARVVLDAAGQGEGSLARLLNDPALYDSLTDSARRAEEALRDIRVVTDKLRREGLILKLD